MIFQCTAVSEVRQSRLAALSPAFAGEIEKRSSRSANMKMQKRLLVARSPMILGPKAKEIRAPGESQNGSSQCGVRVETSGSCNKLMMIPASQRRRPRRSIRWSTVRRGWLRSHPSSWWWLRPARVRVLRQNAPVVARRDTSRWRRPKTNAKDFDGNDQATPIKTRRQGRRGSGCR